MKIEKIKFGLCYPKVTAAELWRNYKVSKDPPYNPEGINVHNQDWDILLILDACRYDLFAERNSLEGDLSKRRSRGSTSEEWIRGNFSDGSYGDLVVISANPFYRQLAEEVGISVHRFEWVEPKDSSSGLTPPDDITERTLEMIEEFPNKRILAHYMQPHAPYLGPSGEDVSFQSEPLQKAVRRNDISENSIREAYKENFDLVQESIQPIIEGSFGKTVISADHGEMLGEPLFGNIGSFSYYGHPYGCGVSCVRSVPWFVSANSEDNRREIISEGTNPINSANVDEQLQALGYL
ncbi:alkaline phosphatase family protein [Halosimplex halophilum]|uniref:hypothetical protein n=1 Tax=Halosimplex halophilum TaxID=2559572 RepID=UPI00107F9B9B|nr:hypothetical protein [Halosimplex halophilum]